MKFERTTLIVIKYKRNVQILKANVKNLKMYEWWHGVRVNPTKTLLQLMIDWIMTKKPLSWKKKVWRGRAQEGPRGIKIPLYEGYETIRSKSLILFLNCLINFGVSITCADDLFSSNLINWLVIHHIHLHFPFMWDMFFFCRWWEEWSVEKYLRWVSRNSRVSSKVHKRLEMYSPHLGREEEQHGMMPISTPIDMAHGAHVWRGYMVLTT